VQTEVVLPAGETSLVADVSVAVDGRVYFFDVAIVSPASPSSVALGSAQVSLMAASKKEVDKLSKYRPALTALGYGEQALLPFVVEASGHLGLAASRWLAGFLSGEHAAAAAFFVDRVQTVLAKYHAWLAESCGVVQVQIPGLT